ILRALGSTAAEVLTLEKIGEAHATTGRSKAARMAYDEALRVSKTVDERRWSSRIHLGLGDLDLAAGDLGAARAAFDLALDLSRDQGDPTGETLALAGLARAARHEGRLAAAADRADEALHRIESLRANAGTEHSRATYLAKHRPIYELAIEVAMERHRREPGGGHDGSALGLAERARARVLLEELADMRADLRDDVDPDLLERERSLEQRIRSRERYRFEKARRMNAAARVELGREISELIVEQREVREAIRRSSPRFAALHQPSPLNLEGIQREVLDRDTTLLEYFLGEERSFLWVVSSHSLDSFELPPRVEIETLALRIYELVKAASERPGLATVEQRRAQQEERAAADDALRRAGRQLSQMVLGPASEVLRGKRLVVVADGALQYLPFGALPLPGNNGGTGSGSEPPLLRDYEVVHLPSASALASVRQAAEGRLTAKKSIAILADPVFRAGELRTRPRRAGEVGQKAPPDRAEGNRETWSPAVRSARDTYLGSLVRLPATTEEALAIARLAPEGDAFTALGLDASRPTAMSPELRDYRFVHFATHGLMHSQH
ncbi:MAG: CHAT domain-containing protein, partial [Acidobacteriota bacterium]